MRLWAAIVFLLIIIAGLSLRVPRIADRPLHHDEANQAYRFGVLLEEGTYEYDAEDHHGPTLYYLTLPIAWLTGVKTFAESSEFTYRALPILFGMLLILATPLLRCGVGRGAALSAALLTAISPGMAYYSRFYIQEMLLVFFTFLMIAAAWRSIKYGSRTWALICGLAAGLMFATKETAIIAYAAIVGAGLLCWLVSRNMHVPLKNIALMLGAGGIVAFILFSSFLTNLDGPLDAILAFKGYAARGAGVDTDHTHPWYFYLRMLTYYRFDGGPVWSEGLILGLGLVGMGAVSTKKLPGSVDLGLARFILFYTLLLTAAYSVLSYKTPWCVLSPLHGWILLAGIGVSSLVVGCRALVTIRSAVIVCQVVIFLALAWPTFATYRLAQRTVFRYGADYRNPYVYAHTAPDFRNLVERLDALKAVSPKHEMMYIQVIAKPDSTWPLPFYLRAYPNVGYWTDAAEVPGEIEPDIIISSPDFGTHPDAYLSEFYGLRADTLIAIHINRALWGAFIETRR